MYVSLVLSSVPAEIWNLLDEFLLDSNLIYFLVLHEKKMNLQLDKWKLEYLWKRKNPKILWMPPSLNYPNIRLGIPYLEIKVISENKYQKRIEYLPNTIIEEI